MIIGNGFDLYHGMNTGYDRFLEFLSNLCAGKYASNEKLNNEIDDVFPDYKDSSLVSYFLTIYEDNKSKALKWIDMETELKVYINKVKDFIVSENEESATKGRRDRLYKYRITHIPVEKKLIITSLKSITNIAAGNDYVVDNKYIDSWGYLDKVKILNMLNQELDGITGLLRAYLSIIEPTTRKNEITPKDLIRNIEPTFVLSFNYTDTYQRIYNIDRSNICYIHGSIEDKNMVIGYDDIDEADDDVKFKKYYRRLINKTDYRYEDGSLDSYGGWNAYPLHFFGHSLDVSDEDVLKELLKEERETHIYYKDEDDRANKILNLVKLIGKPTTIKRIQRGIISLEKIDEVN